MKPKSWQRRGFVIGIFIAIAAVVIFKNLDNNEKEKALEIKSATVEQTKAPTMPTATATEIFNLRSKCAALGDKILWDYPAGTAFYQSQVSHYDPVTNHCYVELTTQNADTAKLLDYFIRRLFDGQTSEMLAVASLKNGVKSGMVYDNQHIPTVDIAVNAGWDNANDYIDKMMKEDRK